MQNHNYWILFPKIFLHMFTGCLNLKKSEWERRKVRFLTSGQVCQMRFDGAHQVDI